MKKLPMLLIILFATACLKGQGKVDRCAIGKYLSHAHALKSIKTQYPKFYNKFEVEVPFMIEGCQNGRLDLSKAAQETLHKFYA